MRTRITACVSVCVKLASHIVQNKKWNAHPDAAFERDTFLSGFIERIHYYVTSQSVDATCAT